MSDSSPSEPQPEAPEVQPLPEDFVEVMEYLNRKYRLYMREPRTRPIFEAIRPVGAPVNRAGELIPNRPELQPGYPRENIPSAAPKPAPEVPAPDGPEPNLEDLQAATEAQAAETLQAEEDAVVWPEGEEPSGTDEPQSG